MAHLLQQWLNEDVKMSRPVLSIKDDFANGYLFGEVLRRFNQLESFKKMRDKETMHAVIDNFCCLKESLRRLDIDFDAKTVSDIRKKKSGAASLVLHKIKVVIDQILSSPSSKTKADYCGGKSGNNDKERSLEKKTTFPPLCVVTMRRSKEVADRVDLDVFKNSLRRIIKSDNDMMLDKHMEARFSETRRSIVENARQMREDESLRATQKLEELRTLSALRVQKARERLHNAGPDSSVWEENLKKMAKSKSDRQNFKAAQKCKRAVLLNKMNNEERQETIRAIEEVMRAEAIARNHEKLFTENRTARESSYEDQRLIEKKNKEAIEGHMLTLAQHDASLDSKRANAQMKVGLSRRRRDENAENSAFCGDLLGRIVDYSCEIAKFRRQWYGHPLKNQNTSSKVVGEAARVIAKDDFGIPDHILSSLKAVYAARDLPMSCALQTTVTSATSTAVARAALDSYISQSKQMELRANSVFTPSNDHVRQVFERFDEGKSGEIDSVELKHVLRDLHLPCNRRTRARIMQRLDANKSGKIDSKEFSEWFRTSVICVGEIVRHVSCPSNESKYHCIGVADKRSASELHVCVCGPSFSGRSAVARRVAHNHDLTLISVDDIVADAINGTDEDDCEEARRFRNVARSGRSVPDTLVVDLIVRKLRDNASSGWVLDGFPESAEQARLFEFALSGFDLSAHRDAVDAAPPSRLWSVANSTPHDTENGSQKIYPSSIDAVIRLECSPEKAFGRAFGERLVQRDGNSFREDVSYCHLHARPPLMGDGNVRFLRRVPEPSGHRTNIGENIAEDSTKRDDLKHWYAMFGTMHVVNTSEALFAPSFNDKMMERVDRIVVDTMDFRAKQCKDFAEAHRRADASHETKCSLFDAFSDVVGTYVFEPPKEDIANGDENVSQIWTLRLTGIAESPNGDEFCMRRKSDNTIMCENSNTILKIVFDEDSAIPKDEEKCGESNESATEETGRDANKKTAVGLWITTADMERKCEEKREAEKMAAEEAAAALVAAAKEEEEEDKNNAGDGEKKDTKKFTTGDNAKESKTPTGVDEKESEDVEIRTIFSRRTAQDPPPPLESWHIRYSVPSICLREESASFLVEEWQVAEMPFLRGTEAVFGDLHADAVRRLDYVDEMRRGFISLLQTPCHDLATLKTFQRAFNLVPLGLRHEEVTKDELHVRTTELCDKIEASIKRHEEETTERLAALQHNGWVEAETTTTMSRIATAIQLELNKFWQIVIFVRDYEAIASNKNIELEESSVICEKKSSDLKKKVAKKKKNTTKENTDDGGDSTVPKCLPVFDVVTSFAEKMTKATSASIDRKHPKTSAPKMGKKSGAKKSGASKKKPPTTETSCKSDTNACTAIAELLDDIFQRLSSVTPTLGLDNIAGISPTLSSEDLSTLMNSIDPVALAMKRKEPGNVVIEREALRLVFALQWWYSLCCDRVEALHRHIQTTLSKLRRRLNERFGCLRAAVRGLEAFARRSIEQERTLPFEIRLEGVHVVIDESRRVLPESPPPPTLDIQNDHSTQFSPRQLLTFARDLARLSKGKSILSAGLFLSAAMRAAASGRRDLPSTWEAMTEAQWREILDRFDSRGYVPWRKILLSFVRFGTHPDVNATISLEKLRTMKSAFVNVSSGRDVVTRREFDLVQLWFETNDLGVEISSKDKKRGGLSDLKDVFWYGWRNRDNEFHFMNFLLDMCCDASLKVALRKAFVLTSLEERTVSESDVAFVLAEERGPYSRRGEMLKENDDDVDSRGSATTGSRLDIEDAIESIVASGNFKDGVNPPLPAFSVVDLRCAFG
eukprot:g955.t1